MVVGLGVDIIEIERIGQALQDHGQRFLDRLLLPAEQQYWSERGRRLDTLAGFWAAKEAVAKALGTGFGGFGLTHIEITHDSKGRPDVCLLDQAEQIADSLQISKILLSISHSRTHALAQAIALTGC